MGAGGWRLPQQPWLTALRRRRYRDLSYSIWGPFGFWATVLFQQVASIGNNITVQIAASISAKVRSGPRCKWPGSACLAAHGRANDSLSPNLPAACDQMVACNLAGAGHLSARGTSNH